MAPNTGWSWDSKESRTALPASSVQLGRFAAQNVVVQGGSACVGNRQQLLAAVGAVPGIL